MDINRASDAFRDDQLAGVTPRGAGWQADDGRQLSVGMTRKAFFCHMS